MGLKENLLIRIIPLIIVNNFIEKVQCQQEQSWVEYSNYGYYTTLAPPAIGPSYQAPAPPASNQAVAVEMTASPVNIPETTPSTTTAVTTTTEKNPFIPKLVTYWGQNAAEKVIGTTESSLESLCTNRSPYSTIIIGYVNKFSDKQNIDKLPGMSFTIHCRKSYSDKYHSLLYCPEIANDIRYCHDKGIKILIGIGGPNSASYFENDVKAEKLAKDIWNLFLGGDEMPDLRPFGSVVLDGINMFMEPHTHDLHHDHTFLMTLHQLRRDDLARNYLITLSPSCLFPDPYFGPGRDKVLQESISLIDQIYVRYTNPRCCLKNSLGFERSINRWRNFITLVELKNLKAPELFIGAPATASSVVNEGCYRSPKELLPIMNILRKTSKFRGIIVIDNAFDIGNGGTGFTFSKELLRTLLPQQLHNIPKFKPILASNDSLSTVADPVHDDITAENDDDDDDVGNDSEDTENDNQEYMDHSIQSAGDKVHLRPTKPIIVNSSASQEDGNNFEWNPTHENSSVTHNDDDLMAIAAETQSNDHTNHDQDGTYEKMKERLLSNATVNPGQHVVTSETSGQNIPVTYQENVNNEDEEATESENENSENVEEIVEEEKQGPENDPVLNNGATTGETPNGISIDYPINNITTNTDSDYITENELKHIHNHRKIKMHKTKNIKNNGDSEDDFIVPFFDRTYPTLVPTAISNRKNWKDMKLKKMGKQKFHGHEKQDHIRPFFDRNLPTLKPTARSGKNWKNQKTFYRPVSNESISRMDLWSSIFPKNGSVEHLISKHISDKKLKEKNKKKVKKQGKSFCERCRKRDTGSCKCQHITYEDCKICRNHLTKKCQNVCLKIDKLLHNIDKELNSTLEKEYLSNRFKNYSRIMLEKRINDEEKIVEKKHDNKHEKSKLIKVFSKLREMIRDDIRKYTNLSEKQNKSHSLNKNNASTRDDLKSLKFVHNYQLPYIVTPLHTGKLHTLKIENSENKLKFHHIANGIKTALQVQKLGESHKTAKTKLNDLHFQQQPKYVFSLNEKTHKNLLRKLNLIGNRTIESDKKFKFSNETKEIIKQAVKFLQQKNKSKKPKHFAANDKSDERISDSESGSGDLQTDEEKNRSSNFNVIPKMYDDLKNFIVEDIANKANEEVDKNDLDEDFRFLYDDDDDPDMDLYDDDGSGSGEPYEEDIVYFYPDGSLQNYASPKTYDSKTYWKEDFEHRVPNVADTMTGQRSPDYEWKVPNVFNPFGNSELPLKHGAQMEENSKYLKLLQDDIQKQIDTFNDQIIVEQPVKPEDVKSNNTKPQRLPEEELDKLTNNLPPPDIFENNDATNEVVQQESKKHDSVPQITHTENNNNPLSVSENIIPPSELKKLIQFSNENNEAFLQFKDLETSTDNAVGKDLISNVNVKGNMDQLKYLMSEMQKTIDDANNAIQEKQMEDLNEVDAEEAKCKNKDKNSNDENEN